MSMRLDGVDQLINDFAAMAARLNEDGPTCNEILEAAAVPIHQQMKSNASTACCARRSGLRSSTTTDGSPRSRFDVCASLS